MWKEYGHVAARNVRQRRLRSWLTIIGIVIGMAAVVALISLGGGLRTAISAQFGSIGADKITITPKGPGFGPPGSFSTTKLTKDDLRIVRQVNGVDLAIGRVLSPVQVTDGEKSLFTFAVSVPADRESKKLVMDSLNMKIDRGRMVGKGDRLNVVVGHTVAEEEFSDPLQVRQTITLQNTTVRVVGILKPTGNFQIDDSIIILEEPMRDFLSINEREYDVIVAQILEGVEPSNVRDRIARELRNERNVEVGEESFEVSSPEQTIASLNNILLVVNAVVVGIAAISLLVGGIGVMNTMYTAVLQRTREIGVMKAVGGTRSQIITLFLLESAILGAAGGVIGVVLGVGLSQGAVIAGQAATGSALLQASISLPLLLGAMVFASFIGIVSGIWPARQAARQDPVDALRYE